MSESVHVIARFVAKPDCVDELNELLVGLIQPTRAEQGCIRYVLYRNQARAAEFVFVEEWTSKAVLDQHLETPHLTHAKSHFDDLLAEPPQIDLFDMVE